MKNKILKLIAATTLIMVTLTGCGNAKTNANTAKGEKITIEYWHCNSETQGGKTVDELVEKFNKENEKIEVVAKYNPDMYKGLLQNFQAEAATGKVPDVIQVGWAFLDYFSNNFKYTEPQAIIDKHFPEDKTFLSDNFLPNILELAKNKDKSQVGIPYSLSTPVLYINKDIFKEAGLDENGPTTWEDVQKFSDTIKEKTGKYGIYIQEPADNWATQAILESNGARMITDGKASFASPEGIQAYEAYTDMITKTKSALHISWSEGVQSFVDGNVGMLYTTIAQRANVQKGAKFNVAAINSPSWSGKKKRLPAGGCFLAITAQDEEKQKAAWEPEKYLNSAESVAEWTKGTGYVPPREGVAEAENGLKSFLEENEMMKAATTQMESVVSWTSFPGDSGLEAEQILLDTRDKILSGSESTAEGLKKAQEDINKLLVD